MYFVKLPLISGIPLEDCNLWEKYVVVLMEFNLHNKINEVCSDDDVQFYNFHGTNNLKDGAMCHVNSLMSNDRET